MSEKKGNIKWKTSVMELPDDVSFDGCLNRLNSPNEYNGNDRLFAYDCWKISDYAVIDNRLADDVLNVYDVLLEKGVPNEVESNISQSLGKMVSYCPELRDNVVELGVKHHPLFEKDLTNYSHLYSEQIESMQSDISERLADKNKNILDNLKDKMGINKTNKENSGAENNVSTPKVDIKRDNFER